MTNKEKIMEKVIQRVIYRIRYYMDEDKKFPYFRLKFYNTKNGHSATFQSFNLDDPFLYKEYPNLDPLTDYLSQEGWNDVLKKHFNDEVKLIEIYKNTMWNIPEFIIPSRITVGNFACGSRNYIGIIADPETIKCSFRYCGDYANRIIDYSLIKPYLTDTTIERLDYIIAERYLTLVNSVDKKYLHAKNDYEKVHNAIKNILTEEQQLLIEVKKKEK